MQCILPCSATHTITRQRDLVRLFLDFFSLFTLLSLFSVKGRIVVIIPNRWLKLKTSDRQHYIRRNTFLWKKCQTLFHYVVLRQKSFFFLNKIRIIHAILSSQRNFIPRRGICWTLRRCRGPKLYASVHIRIELSYVRVLVHVRVRASILHVMGSEPFTWRNVFYLHSDSGIR